MKISVVIPVFNRENMISRTLDSVLTQSRMADEIIVIDDGSTDDTRKVIHTYPGIKTIHHEETRGVSAARNSGICAAKYEWIAFLDSDDVWKKTKLEQNERYFEMNPSLRIFQNEETWIRNGRFANPKKKHLKHEGWIFKQCLPICIISPSAVLVHTEVFDNVGLFDEAFPVCEDYDLWLRVTPHFRVGLDPSETTIKYGGHSDQLSRKYKAMDLWRIRSMQKQLNEKILSEADRDALKLEMKSKLKIYIKGAQKRNKEISQEELLLKTLEKSNL
jgi:glycosyltransferase involved in cell wall biosynthesis